jgi:hypothetical protein
MSKKEQDLHQLALKQFNEIQSAVHEERQQCLEDRRFYSIAGAQWEGRLGEQFENRPKLEVNKIHLSVIRIINEYRNNRVSVDFIAKDGKSDSTAETCNGLFRADEQDSTADEAYDNAFEEAVGGGIGAWRLRACYEDEENGEDDYQRVKIEPIFDADNSVFFDLSAKRQDKSDAKYCFVVTSMTREAYEEEYEDDVSSWPKMLMGESSFDWSTDDAVFVAEYYKIEEVKEVIRIYETIDGKEERYSEQDFIDDPELEKMLTATGSKEVRQRKIERKKVHKYIMSGSGILEDQGYIAGRHIPIVPIYGKRWVVDNIERCMGHVRLAKDAQRLKNMQLSKLAEISALSSVQKPILTPEQILDHTEMWAEDNIKDYPYLLLNPVTGPNGESQSMGPVGYTQPSAVPPALGALLQITDMDIKEILGNQQGGDDILSGVSGKAVELIQTRLDMQTFIYMSNFAKGMKRCGEIWLSMAKELYVESGRKMKKMGEEGGIDMIELMRPDVNESGEIIMENDLTKGNFDVVVDVGPSSSSKKAATVRALTGMMAVTQDPGDMQILSAMSMMNMEGEGIGDIREFFRKKLVRQGVMEPTKEDQEEMAAEQAAQTDPNAEYMAAAAEEATAKAAKARADTVETIASAELKKAQAEQIRQEMILEGENLRINYTMQNREHDRKDFEAMRK